eukprot:2183381-Pleurochrysis_carterae.AAC.3
MLHVRQVRREEAGERRHGANTGQRGAVALVGCKLRDGLHRMVRGVGVGVEERDESGKPAQIVDGGAQVWLARHGGDGRDGRAFCEALRRRERAVRAEVAKGDGGVRLELHVAVLEQLKHGLQAARLDDGARLLHVGGELREGRERLQLLRLIVAEQSLGEHDDATRLEELLGVGHVAGAERGDEVGGELRQLGRA